MVQLLACMIGGRGEACRTAAAKLAPAHKSYKFGMPVCLNLANNVRCLSLQEAVARLQQEAREKQERAIEALEELKEAKQRLQVGREPVAASVHALHSLSVGLVGCTLWLQVGGLQPQHLIAPHRWSFFCLPGAATLTM